MRKLGNTQKAPDVSTLTMAKWLIIMSMQMFPNCVGDVSMSDKIKPHTISIVVINL